MSFILPQNETERLAALRAYDILDSQPEQAFDDLAHLAAIICGAPTALVSLIDENRLWLKSCGSVDFTEAPRDIAFCAYTILNPAEVLIVEDATEDARFASNPSVTGAPHIRFYAGAPLVSPEGFALGSLCVLDYEPRTISPAQIESLKMLARQVVLQMQLRRDVAMREKSERNLAASEQRFRDFVDNSLALFCTHDLRGNVLSVNGAAADSVGYDANELVGHSLADFVSKEDPNSTKDYLEQIHKHGRANGLMRVVTKSGENRVWLYSNVVRRDGESGEPYVLGSAQDVTELKQHEEELKHSREQFESFMNNSPAVIFLKDAAGGFVYINEPFEQLFKVRFEDLRGKTELAFTSKEVADNVRANDLLVLETEEPLQTIEIVPTPDGVAHHWLTHKFLIKDERGEKMVGGISVDITDRRRMEIELRRAHDAALESARLKSAFLTNVSHEIRTPMNGVVGMTELLLDTPLDRAQRECAETIRQSADALLTVINDILDLAKIESGKLRFESVDFDVRETIESTVEMLAERTYRKNIEIASLVAPDVPNVLRGDPGRLRQVLTNLIGNAVKFTEQGEIGIFVSVEKQDERRLRLRFTVTDTGIGIAEQDIKNLFQPFVQADNSTTRQFGGTGLGLAISKQIVEMMGGEIAVESQVGKGSRFSFTASFVKNETAKSDKGKNVAQNSTDETEASRASQMQILKGKRILIADASPIIRRALLQYGAVWGLAPVEAASGEETLRILGEAMRAGQPFDAVLMDMNLPDWEGFALTQRIKSDDAFRSARVILTTAYGQRGDAARAQAIGVAGYLTKPIRNAQFYECLVAVFSETAGDTNQKNDFVARENTLVTRHSLREAKTKTDLTPVSFDEKSFPILVVEDNEINRRLLLRQLEQIGVAADTAIDGIDALEKMAAKNYKLVFMDCQMPRLDGYAAAREIRRIEKSRVDEKFPPVTIVALTAHTLAGEREKCLAAGMNDYLSKPIKVREVAAMLEFWNQAAKAGEDAETLNSSPEETLQTDSRSARFDPQPLRDLAAGDGGNAAFAQEIFSLYLEETDARLGDLENAASSGDAQSIARLAHALRGNSLAVGASGVAEIAALIEQAGKETDREKINSLLPHLAREFAAIQTEMLELSEKW